MLLISAMTNMNPKDKIYRKFCINASKNVKNKNIKLKIPFFDIMKVRLFYISWV